MITFEITEEIDTLTRETWGFYAELHSSGSTLCFQRFTREARTSTRAKKWSVDPRGYWSRTNQRDSTLARPEVTPAMIAEVRARICALVMEGEVK